MSSDNKQQDIVSNISASHDVTWLWDGPWVADDGQSKSDDFRTLSHSLTFDVC